MVGGSDYSKIAEQLGEGDEGRHGNVFSGWSWGGVAPPRTVTESLTVARDLARFWRNS